MPQYVTPTVHVVGSMFVDREALIAFLVEIDDELGDWVRRRQNVDDLSLLTEAMGRLCYRSWAPGLNPNVQHIRGDTSSYIENLLFQQHGSVFEHASISFILRNVPRVLTHELVRHRVGVAVSQESMRYVRLTDIPFYMPKIFLQPFPNDEDGEMAENFQNESDWLLERMEEFQKRWADRLALDDPSSNFEWKKTVTSGLRYWAPMGVATSIGWSVNVRELRHIIPLRTSPAAEEAIRTVFNEVATYVTKEWPQLFGDLQKLDDGSWV